MRPRLFDREQITAKTRELVERLPLAPSASDIHFDSGDELADYLLEIDLLGSASTLTVDAEQTAWVFRNGRTSKDLEIAVGAATLVADVFFEPGSELIISGNAHGAVAGKQERDDFFSVFKRPIPGLVEAGFSGIFEVEGWSSRITLGVEPSALVRDGIFASVTTIVPAACARRAADLIVASGKILGQIGLEFVWSD